MRAKSNAVHLGRQPCQIPPRPPLAKGGTGGICSNAAAIVQPYVSSIGAKSLYGRVGMMGWPALFLMLAAVALLWPVLISGSSESSARPVLVIRVEGVIAPSSADYIISAIKRADRELAQALIIELDTPR